MRKYLTILSFLSLSSSINSQLVSYIIHGDTVFYYNPSTRDSMAVNKPALKTVNNTSIWGNGNIAAGGTTDSLVYATKAWKQKGDDSLAALYNNDFRAANFIAGTNYIAPNGNGSSLTGLTASQVNLGNVTNESKATMFTSPTFTGTVSGVTATMVGLGNVNNTSDASKPISTATQTALDLKQNISGNNGGWNVLRVAGSNATTTGQTLVDITGLVTPTLSNATLYEVEAVLYCSTSAVTTGTQYAFTANGTGGAATVFINISGTTTTNAATTVTQSASATAAGTFLTTSGASGIIVMKGFILTRGSGTATIALQHLKITSGTSTVFIGSVLRYRLAQ